jgi:hypothetical protein
MKKLGIGIALFFLLFPINSTWAQGEDPTPINPPMDEGVTVEGTIGNYNEEGLVPEGLSVMLHSWDQSGADRGMIHGESGPNGYFAFENVPVEPGVLYAAMVIYENATYYSVPHLAEGDNPLEPFEVEIYESTNDLSDVKIDLLNMIFGFSQGGLAVGEIYGLSNQGDRTVANAVTFNDGNDATLKFGLPEGAASVSFPGSSGDRFVSYLGGFADLQPLTPGEGSGQIFVSYILPYEDGITLTREAPFQAKGVNLYIPHQSGLSLEPSGAEYIGVKSGSDGESYEHYSLGSLMAEEPFRITLTGTFVVAEIQPTTDAPTINNEIIIGAGILGIGLIFVGVWWWRREDVEEDIEESDSEPSPEFEF